MLREWKKFPRDYNGLKLEVSLTETEQHRSE